MAKNLYSYVVRYDSGFAPNPFYGICTLATCKPQIRSGAEAGDLIVGTGSAAKNINRGGHLVFVMRVTETLQTSEYWNDPRFEDKKPNLYGSWEKASGDNIYFPTGNDRWGQLDSYHSNKDGSLNNDHLKKDTSVPRILISEDFVYFGGEGEILPAEFLDGGATPIVKAGIGYNRIHSNEAINAFEKWFEQLPDRGFCGEPYDWLHLAK